MFSKIITCLLFGALLISGCQDDKKKQMLQKLSGKWDLQEALRNNKATESLQNAYYEFRPDGSMTTNITGVEETTPFELDKNILTQRVVPVVAYRIDQLDERNLVLATNIQSFD